MTDFGVISKVDTPTPWESQVAIVHKKNGDLRICISPLELNKVLPGKHFTLPVLEGTLPSLTQSTVFSKVDLRSGNWGMLRVL